MKQSAEFEIPGDELKYQDMEAIWEAVKQAGNNCRITINQSTYSDGPYGSSTTTYIEVESE